MRNIKDEITSNESREELNGFDVPIFEPVIPRMRSADEMFTMRAESPGMLEFSNEINLLFYLKYTNE